MAQIEDAAGTPILANVSASGTPIALNDEVFLELNGQAGAVYQIAGIGPETYSFEGSVDGVNYFAISGTRLSDGLVATSTNANGLWSFATAGLLAIRLRLSAGAPGTATIFAICGQGVGLPPFGGSVSVVGPVSVAEPVSVDDNGGSLTVDDGGGSITVDGAVSTLTVITDGVDTANVTPAGALVVDGSAVTQPISAAALPLPAGASTAALQLPDGHNVTVDNAAGAAAVNVQDGGNSLTVDGTVAISGTVPISAVSLPLPTGAATSALQTQPGVDIGDVTVNNAAGTNPVPVQGNAAHDAAVAGNPVLLGAEARTTNPVSVADGDAVRVRATKDGRLITAPSAAREQVTQNNITLTTTTETTLVAAGGAGVFNDVTAIIVSNTSGTAVRVDFRDATAGTVRFSLMIAANGGGGIFVPPVPVRQTTANNNWTAQLSGAVTDVRIFAQVIANL